MTSLIPFGAWLWEKYGESIIDRSVDTLKDNWAKFSWRSAANTYRNKIKKIYGTMQIMGMSSPVLLDDIFTDVHLLDKPTALRRFDIRRLKKATLDLPVLPQGHRINGLTLVAEKIKTQRVISKNKDEVLEQRLGLLDEERIEIRERGRNLFILGKPGAGKTTFLKYIAVKAADQVLDKVPVFIALKEWADSGLELFAFILERFDVCAFPNAQPFIKELLESGECIVLFDGLDEVNDNSGKREEQIRAIDKFVQKYDRTQCLITCRIAGTDYSFHPFTYVEISDFSPGQINTFVRQWFRTSEGEKDERTSRSFLEEFNREENKGLRDLARTPLLLTLLCLAFEETLTFPQRRVEIYKEALDALLKKWDSSRRIRRDEVYRKLSLGHKENMLARIAAETFEGYEYFITQDRLVSLINDYIGIVPPHEPESAESGEIVLKAIEAQHGIFVERARRIYSFSHLTFQEYFTSKYVVDNAAAGTLENLVSIHTADDRWREVFLLTASLLPNGSQFMSLFRDSIDDLIANEPKLIKWLEWANQLTDVFEPSKTYEIRARALKYALDRSQDRVLSNALDQALKNAIFAYEYTRLADLTFLQDQASELGYGELAELIGDLYKVIEGARVSRDEYVSSLRFLIAKYDELQADWKLSADQEKLLLTYNRTIKLLKDCLELATMSVNEKQKILNSLYLPPSYKSESVGSS